MGQLITKDNRALLPVQIKPSNVKRVSKQVNFIVCPFLKFKAYQQIFFVQDQKQLQVLYKFDNNFTVNLQLAKEEANNAEGIFIKIANQYVYAYKHRKLQKVDKIKPQRIIFKKRLYLSQTQKKIIDQQNVDEKTRASLKKTLLLKKLCQTKLLSLLSICPKLGRTSLSHDGILTPLYIQYFTQIAVQQIYSCIPKNSQLKLFQNKLKSLQIFSQEVMNINNLCYSQRSKGYLFKIAKDRQMKAVNHMNEIQVEETYENQSIHFLVRIFQTEVQKAIMHLQNQANGLGYINNLIIHHDQPQTIKHINTSKNIIQPDRQIKQNHQNIKIKDQLSSKKKYTHKSFQKKMKISKKSLEETDNVTASDQSSKQNLVSLNQQIQSDHTKTEQTKSQTQFLGIKQSKRELPKGQQVIVRQLTQQQKVKKHDSLCKVLKQSLQNRSPIKTQQTFCQLVQLNHNPSLSIYLTYIQLLLQTCHSRHALSLCQKLLYFTNQSPPHQLFYYNQIALIAGVLFWERNMILKAEKMFQRCLGILVRLGHKSTRMMLVRSNLAVLAYKLGKIQQATSHLTKGFAIIDYSPDYQYLMRSNMAMVLAQKGMIKQAKLQMAKVNKIVEPVNNMVIYCKFYSNLASDNRNLQRALPNFQQSYTIQQKYLIPHGYPPSIFLHNNLAILYLKTKRLKKAKLHCQILSPLLSSINGLTGVEIHFNIGVILSEGYDYEVVFKHFGEAFSLLARMQQDQIVLKYKNRITNQIQKIERNRILEEPEEESHKISYLSSNLTKRNK